VELRRLLVKHRAELVVRQERAEGGKPRSQAKKPRSVFGRPCGRTAVRLSPSPTPSDHQRRTTVPPFTPSTARCAEISVGTGWCRLRQPSRQMRRSCSVRSTGIPCGEQARRAGALSAVIINRPDHSKTANCAHCPPTAAIR
jgi:hypothetical protein